MLYNAVNAFIDRVIVWIIFIGLLLPTICMAEGLDVGAAAPFFKVKSGDNKELTLNMVKGKLIVIFYETKDVVEKNRKLKEGLNKFYDEQPDTIKKLIVRLPVINCSSASWPLKGIWRNNLRKNSTKEGITIYGDWDGEMSSDYKVKDKESNVVIIDKGGIIRYFAFGKVKDEKIYEIKGLLDRLTYEKKSGR